MKYFASALLSVILVTHMECVVGFQKCAMQYGRSSTTAATATQLYGMFDFKPFHGHGSGETNSDLDEQWEAQQEILRARRGHLDKEHLKQKYARGASPKDNTFAGKGGDRLAADDMWIDEGPRKSKKTQAGDGKNKVKFFWEK